MIQELLLLGGYFVHFGLTGLNLRPGAGVPRHGGISILLVPFVFLIVVMCGGNQLILFCGSVAHAKMQSSSGEEC
jgi:hypothetical protein